MIAKHGSCTGKEVIVEWKVDGSKDRRIKVDDVVLSSQTPSDVSGTFLGVVANLQF